MQVLYVDVYFLINFTVDTVALFLSVKLSHARSDIWRLMLCGVLGAIGAIIEALSSAGFIRILCGIVFYSAVAILAFKEAAFMRRIKLLAVFLCFQMMIGGAVSYAYSLLDSHTEGIEEYFSEGTANRKLLVFSVLILFAIGVLKLFIMLFGEQIDVESARIRIKIGASSVECEALVDSGNLVKDPMNMNPVLFIKQPIAERLLPRAILELSEIDKLDPLLRRRIRLIPVSRGGETHVVTGFLPDEVICIEPCGYAISVTLAIDKKEGTYGGFEALLPSSVLSV